MRVKSPRATLVWSLETQLVEGRCGPLRCGGSKRASFLISERVSRARAGELVRISVGFVTRPTN